MASITHYSTKKTFFYNFFPSKAEEEASSADPNHTVHRPGRVLMEIRDVYQPPVWNPLDPWVIKQTLTYHDIVSGTICVSFNDTFEHVFRYWHIGLATQIAVLGNKVGVVLFDVTDEHNPRRYGGNQVSLQMTPTQQFILSCKEMMMDRNLRVNDVIGLYWDTRIPSFRVKLLYSNPQ